ncbi:MAG: A/G-specific adenine glycosylase [Vulcanimicrobiaceae bacterium]
MAIAEILLQKTRAASVVATYLTLNEKYPSAETLARANVAEVEKMLRPLGLSNKRALQLVSMAKAAVEIGNSVFDDWKMLLKDVPGLGVYAARAIASFSRSERVGIVDANIARILRRIFRVRTRDPRAAIYQRLADEIAETSDDVRATNFGLLDIGAAICVPKPLCQQCQFCSFCPRYGVKT